jgi:hypothetical protein
MRVVPNTKAMACGFSNKAKRAAEDTQKDDPRARRRTGMKLNDFVSILPKSRTQKRETAESTLISFFELAEATAV